MVAAYQEGNTMREKVIAILSTHDALPVGQKSEFVAYLNDVFSKAEQFDSLAGRVAAIESVVANH